MTLWDQFLWGAFPYIALTIFVAGTVWRYSADPYGWTSKSSELLEKRWLGWGTQLFHYGFVVVVVGHVMGLLIPPALDALLGLGPEAYHAVAFYGGSAAGVVALAGLGILLVRRLANTRIRRTSTPTDFLTLALLIGVMALGLVDTLFYRVLVGAYDYRDTVGVWVRGLLTLTPNVSAVAAAPLFFRVHALAGLLFFALLPFTRLVHLFSLPFHYLTRRPIVFRTSRPRREVVREIE